MKLVHVTTIPESLIFLHGQPAAMRQAGIETAVVSSAGEALGAFAAREGVAAYAVEMPRQITPLHDLGAVARLRSCLERIRPDVVHAHTPKGGLLGMLAARLAGVPVRVYHIHGMPYVTATGFRRILLRYTEKVSCTLAHQVFAVSGSLRDQAVADGICPAGKVMTLACGSINGVDAEHRFRPDAVSDEEKRELRTRLGIPEGAPVAGFVGRLVGDKGIGELAAAWLRLRDQLPELHLVVVGPEEGADAVYQESARVLRSDPRVHLTGGVADPVPYFALLQVLLLPTHREGFGMVALEASAMGVPVVATRIPGCVDAVQDGVTGTLVPVRDAEALAAAALRYLREPELRRAHGVAGRERALRDFRPEAVWSALRGEYRRLLRERGRLAE